MAKKKYVTKRNVAATKKLLKNKSALFIVLAVVIAVAVLFLFFPEQAEFLFGDGAPEEVYVGDGSARFYFIDVGQGDSILIKTNAGDVLIDAGPSASEDELVRYLESVGVDDIEYLVLTHPHSDHIGGADAILEKFDVKRVILPETDCSTNMYLKVLGLIEKEKCEAIISKALDTYTLGELKMTLLAPNGVTYEGYNDYSVVIRAEMGNSSVLLTGDAEKISENEMLKNIPRSLLRCDVLKVGHHGSTTSTTGSFFDAVSPEYAVISCGKNNDYGHPHREIISLLDGLSDAGKLYRTDVSGTVIFDTDGNTFTITVEK